MFRERVFGLGFKMPMKISKDSRVRVLTLSSRDGLQLLTERVDAEYMPGTLTCTCHAGFPLRNLITTQNVCPNSSFLLITNHLQRAKKKKNTHVCIKLSSPKQWPETTYQVMWRLLELVGIVWHLENLILL